MMLNKLSKGHVSQQFGMSASDCGFYSAAGGFHNFLSPSGCSLLMSDDQTPLESWAMLLLYGPAILLKAIQWDPYKLCQI